MQKITILTETLKYAVAKLNHSFNAKALLPALTHVHCSVGSNIMVMTTSDMELTGSISVEAGSNADGAFLMPFAQLGQILSVVSTDEVELLVNKTKITIQSGFDEYELKPTSKLEEFPLGKIEQMSNELNLSKDVISAIKTASVLLERNETRPWMNTVLLECSGSYRIVSTNSMSLFKIDVPSENAPPSGRLLILERVIKAMEEVNVPTIIKYNGSHMVMEQLNYTIKSVLVETKYPPYQQVIPDTTANITIDRDSLLQAVKKCNLVSDALKTLHFSIKGKEVELATKSEANGLKVQTRLQIEEDSTNVEKQVLTTELLKVLNETKYKTLGLSLEEGSKMLVITTPEDLNFLSLVVLKTA